ncbi:MAG: type II secretion system protein [Gammaproteobacteria bacterium]|nr:MAG: type II secretion system protein [Gammaproteobacteria bacterium]
MFELSPQALIAGALSGIGIACAGSFIALLFINSRAIEDEEWRDTPPFIFRIFRPLTRLFAHYVKPKIPETYYQKLSNKMSTAGLSYTLVPEELVTLRFILLFVVSLIFGTLLTFSQQFELRAASLVFILLSFFYPQLWLNDKVKMRRIKIEREFPFLLDLLVLAMQAGLNYSTSLSQSVVNLPESAVKEEFSRLLREIRAGKDRRAALNDMGQRMDVPSISNFVAAINQAEETGGEIGDVLKAQAKQRRVERFNNAEKAANQAPVKMILPLVLFLFPVLFMLVGFVMMAKAVEAGVAPDWIASLLT